MKLRTKESYDEIRIFHRVARRKAKRPNNLRIRSMVENTGEQLKEIQGLIVSGKLVGELPSGFLSVFKNLPNELMLKVWSYITTKNSLMLRLVSKHWNYLWKASRRRPCVLRELSLKMRHPGKVIFEGVGGFRVRIIETNLDQDEIRHIMSMIEFENYQVSQCNVLNIYGSAANDVVLREAAQQNWMVSRIIFTGDMSELHESALALFIRETCEKRVWPQRVPVHFKKVASEQNVISDGIIEACGDHLQEFSWALSPSQNSMLMLTDRSLKYLIADEMSAVIPECTVFSIEGIFEALQRFFDPSRKEVTQRRAFFYAGCQSRLWTLRSDHLNASHVAKLTVTANGAVVQKHFRRRVTELDSRQNFVSVSNPDLLDDGYGEIHFSHRCNEYVYAHGRRSVAIEFFSYEQFCRIADLGIYRYIPANPSPDESSQEFDDEENDDWSSDEIRVVFPDDFR